VAEQRLQGLVLTVFPCIAVARLHLPKFRPARRKPFSRARVGPELQLLVQLVP
jgi:hypothetical protein